MVKWWDWGRLSEQQYRHSIADIFGKDIAVQGMFEPGVRMGGLIAASSAVLSMTRPGFESYFKMADGIAVAKAQCQPQDLDEDDCAAKLASRPERQVNNTASATVDTANKP